MCNRPLEEADVRDTAALMTRVFWTAPESVTGPDAM